jgi:tetratricopeptide (TPR) repeat protein
MGKFSGVPGPGDEGADAAKEARTELQSGILLGDLHLRQGQYKTAITAYEKALALAQKALERQPDQKQQILTLTELYSKLAQARLGAGEADKAREALEHAMAYARLAEKASGKGEEGGGPPKESALPLPSRLILSVPKKLLDQVGSGKMSYEEFRKAASIEYVK